MTQKKYRTYFFHIAIILLATSFLIQCEYLSDPNLLRKTSDDTEDFKCTITSNTEDGIFKNTTYDYTVRCIVKKGKVRFINFNVSLIATGRGADRRSQTRALAERRLRNAPVVVTPKRPFEYSGQFKLSALTSRKGRRKLHFSSVVDYPGSDLNVEQDKINKPWRYNMLATHRL